MMGDIPLLFRLARHIRQTDEISPLKWGMQGCDLLVEVQRLYPEEYEKFVKSPATSVLTTLASRARQFAAFLNAYIECSAEVQQIIRDMAAVVEDDVASEEDKERAVNVMVEALFHGPANRELIALNIVTAAYIQAEHESPTCRRLS